MADFERNFYKPSAVCPKCGTGNPKPKYHPPDCRFYFMVMDMWCRMKSDYQLYGLGEVPAQRPSMNMVEPDYVACLCICGHEWKEPVDIQPQS